MENDSNQLKHPWLVAVWPGMGNLAVSAGYYLMAKLQMRQLAEFSSPELFDLNHIEVRDGIIRLGHLPRSRLFVWRDPQQKHDIVVFIGEAQPTTGKYIFCRKLIEFTRELGVEKVITFAAMTTGMHPEQGARVFGAATDQETLGQLQGLGLQIIKGGQISGLNGMLLGAASERGLPGACLLGEMPHMFAGLSFPKAAMAVLKVFADIAHINLDLSELADQARQMEKELDGLLTQIEKAGGQQPGKPNMPPWTGPPEVEAEETNQPHIMAKQLQQIDSLFAQASQDRSKAYELKALLDRLNIFEEYEDRFLDLFQKPD